MTYFGPKEGQGLENQDPHPDQKFREDTLFEYITALRLNCVNLEQSECKALKTVVGLGRALTKVESQTPFT